jgi:hypothetical protein
VSIWANDEIDRAMIRTRTEKERITPPIIVLKPSMRASPEYLSGNYLNKNAKHVPV